VVNGAADFPSVVETLRNDDGWKIRRSIHRVSREHALAASHNAIYQQRVRGQFPLTAPLSSLSNTTTRGSSPLSVKLSSSMFCMSGDFLAKKSPDIQNISSSRGKNPVHLSVIGAADHAQMDGIFTPAA